MMLCSSHCILSCGAWLWFISLFMMFILFSGLRWFCQVSHCKLTPCNNKHSVGRYFQAIWISLIKLKFIYLYISVWIHGFPFYSVHYNLLILFCQWDSLEADFCILLICSYHWEFPCWHRMFQVHLVPFSCHNPGISHFSTELWRILFRKQLGVCSLLLECCSSQALQ